jgi:hypothetical protein
VAAAADRNDIRCFSRKDSLPGARRKQINLLIKKSRRSEKMTFCSFLFHANKKPTGKSEQSEVHPRNAEVRLSKNERSEV